MRCIAHRWDWTPNDDTLFCIRYITSTCQYPVTMRFTSLSTPFPPL